MKGNNLENNKITIRKDRVKKTLAKEEVDYTPFHIAMTNRLRERVADYYKVSINKLENVIGNHLLFINFKHGREYIPIRPVPDLEIDEFGVTWNYKKIDTGDWGMIEHVLKSPDMTSYKWPDPYAVGRFDHIPDMVEDNPGRFNVLDTPGIFDTCWHIRGFENLLMDMALNQGFVNEMMDKAVEFILGLIETFPTQIDGFRLVEDWGQQKGLLFRKNYWNVFLKPRLKIVYEACKRREVSVMVHSCGDIKELIPDLIELGVDILDPVQPEVMNISFLKKEYGKDLIFMGGLGSQSTMPKGTPDIVRKDFCKTLKILGNNGGYIAGPAGAMATDIPVENVVALVEVCQKMCPVF